MGTISLHSNFVTSLIHFFSGLQDFTNNNSSHKSQAAVCNNKNEWRVMLADDDDDDRFFFAQAINELSPSINLVTSRDGAELLQILQNETDLPDLIFLDLNMPRKNGFECLLELKQHVKLKDIPVIIYSTSANPHQVEDTYKHGANLYIQKPDSFGRIKELLQKVLSLNRSELKQQAERKAFLFR